MTVQKGKLSKQAWMVAPETVKVMEVLGDARFVGGCVRDALANRKTVDIDIATPLTPEEVIEVLEKNKIKCIPTGLKYGTVTAVIEGKPFEITTLREDVVTDGRYAEVEFTDDWEKDAARRDFTINAMSATLEGEVFDYFGGIEDLRLGRVHFVGDALKRVEEDYLRILRFFRFFAFFGRGMADKEALEACIAAASKISTLSKERISKEILKLLESGNAAEVWKLMLECGIVRQFLPEAINIEALEKLIELENKYSSQSFAIRRLVALINNIDDVKTAMRLSGDQSDMVDKMFNMHSKISIKDIDKEDVQRLVYKHGNDMVRSLFLLAATKDNDTEGLHGLYNEATVFRAPRLPVQGKDILALGIEEGPEVGIMLRKVENWWLDNDFTPNRVECLDKIKTLSYK